MSTTFTSEEMERMTRSQLSKPLENSGSMDQFEFTEVTPVIGREYRSLQISELLKAPNSERILQDLASIISHRGVVFFRNQVGYALQLVPKSTYLMDIMQDLKLEEQKRFVDILSKLSGRPPTSGFHVHPLFKSPDNDAIDDAGNFDENVYVVSNRAQVKLYKEMPHRNTVTDAAVGWHTDITFERVPADYSCLIMRVVPPSGGDTMWCSATALYEKISPAYRKFLETLTATFAQPVFMQSAERGKYDVMSPRGSPLNSGTEFSAVHPVVRTNPVTGLKSVFAVGLHCAKINDVHPYEDRQIRDYFLHLITRNHDIQVRHKWSANDVAIWDNRSAYHAATPDVGDGIRFGNRVTTVGEKPYLIV